MTTTTRRFGHRLLRDIGAPVEGTIVGAAAVTIAGTHAHSATRVVIAWAVVTIVYWLTHIYLHALRDQLSLEAAPLHRRLADNAGLQIGVLVGGVPVILAYLAAVAVGADLDTAVYVALGWTIIQLGATVFIASYAARLSTRRALQESLIASLLGFLLMAAKVFLH
ncbi:MULTISPECIES: hypothetical protein [unclassified Aeromicrobium]|uniref:hypothetical protein n=1 Tax=unclassified Aeromicrobium TaxID=2633570 RepID=UPI00396B2C50